MSWRVITMGICAAALSAPARAAHDRFFKFQGETASGQMGAAVSGAGDVNGDGIPDLIAGASEIGLVRVWSGKDMSLIHQWTAELGFGSAVAAAGDVDDDGRDDVIAGGAGAVRVYSGRTGALLHLKQDVNAGLGQSVAGVGDLDQDGHADFAAGAHLALQGNVERGCARVYSGATGNVLYEWWGASEGGRFGWSLASAGDLDHDGFQDVVVSAPRQEFLFTQVGRFSVYSGKDGSSLGTVFGPLGNDEFGYSVSSGHDLDGDGTSDILVGAPYADPVSTDCGAAYVYSGSDFTLIREFHGWSPDERLGYAVACVDDIDGDGLDDAVIGVPFYVSSPAWRGRVEVYSGNALVRLYRDSYASGGAFGNSLAGMGDLNGDGHADLVVGDRFDDSYVNNGGAVMVLSGWEYDASSNKYGTGWPGGHGIPDLVATSDPLLMTNVNLLAENSSGNDTIGVLFIGTAEADIQTQMGGTLLVQLPAITRTMSIPASGLDLTAQLRDSSLTGFDIYLQLIQWDPSATQGAAFSNGLHLHFGLGS